MINLEYYDEKSNSWVYVGSFGNEQIAWISLNGDDINYRTIENGKILTDKRDYR